MCCHAANATFLFWSVNLVLCQCFRLNVVEKLFYHTLESNLIGRDAEMVLAPAITA